MTSPGVRTWPAWYPDMVGSGTRSGTGSGTRVHMPVPHASYHMRVPHASYHMPVPHAGTTVRLPDVGTTVRLPHVRHFLLFLESNETAFSTSLRNQGNGILYLSQKPRKRHFLLFSKKTSPTVLYRPRLLFSSDLVY